MAYQKEQERTKLGRRLSEEAITLAIQGRWEEAVVVNKRITERFPGDIGAYNRLGRALTELGEFAQAKEAYNKVLELAPLNAIAAKNLARLASLPESKAASGSGRHRIIPALFVAEMGKAGGVNLFNLAPGEILGRMGVGDQVHLKVEGRRLIVENEHGEYLGEVETKCGLRLIRLMEGGNRYAVAILSVGNDRVRVIIREEYQHPSQMGQPSFPVKCSEHLLLSAGEPLVTSNVTAEEDEAIEEGESSEGVEHSNSEEAETLPEGFSVVEKNTEVGEELSE